VPARDVGVGTIQVPLSSLSGFQLESKAVNFSYIWTSAKVAREVAVSGASVALASGFVSSLAGAGGASVDPGAHLPSPAYFS
jgi:hypothetical protein